MATWYDVARIVRELALTSEPSPHDWRVGKKLLAWERPLRPSEREALAHEGSDQPEGDILGVRVSDEGVKFGLIADEPRIYFTTPHFDGYPAVLVNLAEIPCPRPRGPDHGGVADAGPEEVGPGIPGRLALNRSRTASELA